MDMPVTFACVFGTSLLEDLFFEGAQIMRELSELVEAAQSGDSDAYDALIQRFQQMAYTIAYRYLGDHHLAQDLACVRSAIASLPQHEQLVTVLFYGCRYSYNEVSALLKIPLTTVKKRLHSARRKLKVQLQAALRDEIAPRSSDGAEGAEIYLARWWSWLTRCVKEMHDSWQTRYVGAGLAPARRPGDRVRATARVAPTYLYVGAGLAPAQQQAALKRNLIRRRCDERRM